MELIRVAAELNEQAEAFPFPFEYLWAVDLGSGEALIDSIPFFSALNYKDRVEIGALQTPGARFKVLRVLEPSRHATIRVVLTEGENTLAWLQQALGLLLKELKSRGCEHERNGDALYSIDIPPDAGVLHWLVPMLAEGSRERKWEYDFPSSEGS